MATSKMNKSRGSATKRANPYAKTSGDPKDTDDQANSGLNTLEYEDDEKTPDELEAPTNIIKTEAQARNFYQDLLINHSTRFQEYGKIQKQFFGNRPRDPKKLKEQGLAYLSNVNNGHSRIHINRYLSSEYNLIHAVASPINFKVRLIDKKTDHLISKAMERAWKEVYADGWDDYYNQLDAMRQDKTLFGVGITLREFDPKGAKSSWKFRAISTDQFMCPLETDIGREALGKFCILHTKTAQELWEIYENLKGVEGEVWNKDALAYILWRASSRSAGKSQGQEVTSWRNDVLDMQRKLRNYDTSILGSYSDDIALVSVYIKEYNGKWSHTIIHDSYKTASPVFFKSEQYDNIRDFLQVWYFEPNNKTIHSVRGLGYRIFQPVEVQNRLDNVLIDQAHLASTIFVRTRQGRGRDAKSVKIVLGAVNDIGETEFVEQMNNANLQASMGVNQYQAQILERNVQFEKMDLDSVEDNKYRTLGEVGMQATKDAVLTKPQVSFFYRQYNIFMRDTVRLMYSRRADEFFEEWKELVMYELKDLKLPQQVFDILFSYPKDAKGLNIHGLPKWMTVNATRSTSSGSQVADIMAMNRLFPLAPHMGTDERYNFLQMATAAYADHDYVDILFPDKNRPMVFTDHMQKAIIESAILKGGNEIPVSPNDDHREEAPVHLQACQELIQAWAEGADVIQIDDQLRMLYPHFLGHFTMLSQDPMAKAVFEGLSPLRGEVENQYRQIQANALNARAAEQKRQEAERIKEMQQQFKLSPDSPETLKVLVDNELKTRTANLQEARNLRAENLNHIKAKVKSNLDTAITIKKFENDERRENIKLVQQINKDKTNDQSKAKTTSSKK